MKYLVILVAFLGGCVSSNYFWMNGRFTISDKNINWKKHSCPCEIGVK